MSTNGYSTILENIPFGRTISNFIIFLRPAEWIDKIQFNTGAAFLLLMEGFYNKSLFLNSIFNIFTIFIIFQCFLCCFGYAINAYADRVFDQKVGKYRAASYFSKNQISLILIFLSLGCLGIPFLFNDFRLVILGIVTYIFAAGYSMKPLRFKDRGFYGIIGATIPQRPLMILFFGILIGANNGFLTILIVWSLFIGIIMEIGHQMLDFENDKISGVDNWIVNAGFQEVKNYNIYFTSLFVLLTLAPVFFYTYNIGLTFSLLMLIFSGHAYFYFLDGWKAYKKSIYPTS